MKTQRKGKVVQGNWSLFSPSRSKSQVTVSTAPNCNVSLEQGKGAARAAPGVAYDPIRRHRNVPLFLLWWLVGE